MPGLDTIRKLLMITIPLSLVHYTDNAVNYDAYPSGTAAGLFDITDVVVAVSWFLFAAAGIAGYRIYKGGNQLGLIGIAIFSGSGIVSLGHYSVAGMSEVAVWRHVFIWVDIIWGFLVFGFTLWAVQANRRTIAA